MLVKIDHASVADDDFARFTANGLESRSAAETRSDICNNINRGIRRGNGFSNSVRIILWRIHLGVITRDVDVSKLQLELMKHFIQHNLEALLLL